MTPRITAEEGRKRDERSIPRTLPVGKTPIKKATPLKRIGIKTQARNRRERQMPNCVRV